MRIVVARDAAAFARTAADAVAAALATRAGAVLGVATGSTPLPLYRELAGRVRAGVLDVAGVRAFALDEYVGLPEDHPESYRSVVEREVTVPLGLRRQDVRVPPSSPSPEAARAFEAEIAAAGGVDVQILGVGTDGHIGFNEPFSSLQSRTRLVRLTEQTRRDNARFFARAEDVPTHAVTQGIGTILEARELLVLARGTAKARAVAAMIEGPMGARMPASAVQWHPHVTVVLDAEAAAGLTGDAPVETASAA